MMLATGGGGASASGAAAGGSAPAGPSLLALVPPAPGQTVAETPGVLSLIEAAKRLHDQPHRPDPSSSAAVLRDRELAALVLEFVGRDLQLVLPCKTTLPFLTLHIMDVGKFMDVELAVVDHMGELRHVLITNRQSTIRVSAGEASLPLAIAPGAWSLLRLDLAQVTAAAFGKGYAGCAGLVLHSSMRLARAFFSDREYADAELPPFLRALPDDAPEGALGALAGAAAGGPGWP
jgi:hypothetical protein